MEKVSDEQYDKQPFVNSRRKRYEQRTFRIKKNFGDFSPKLVQLTDDVLFGDVWERAELSKRDRSLVTVPHSSPRQLRAAPVPPATGQEKRRH